VKKHKVGETRVKCPKCGSNNLFIMEKIICTTEWEQLDGRILRNEGYHHVGHVVSMDSKCSNCLHVWKIRGALQIDDVLLD
jgi:predicted amidophosphoribosyltransferase